LYSTAEAALLSTSQSVPWIRAVGADPIVRKLLEKVRKEIVVVKPDHEKWLSFLIMKLSF